MSFEYGDNEMAFKPDQNIDLSNDNNNNNNFSINPQENPPQSAEVGLTDFYKKSPNPSVSLTTVVLKLASLLCFLILDWFTSNEAFVMVVVILLDAMDFWYTKNISGRILVGLRWWNKYDSENQKEIWTFESKNEIKEPNIDRKTFWWSLYGFTVIWALLSVWELIRLNFMWCSLCIISLIISGVNTYGFFRCSKLQQKGAKLVAANLLGKYMKKKENQ